MIKRRMVRVNETGLRQAQYSHFNATETTITKGKIRREIDGIDTNDDHPYDLYDQVADALNAIKAIVTVAAANGWDTSGTAFTKFSNRQGQISTIVGNNP